MVPEGARVRVKGSTVAGVVEGPSYSRVFHSRVVMDPGTYDEEAWPGGIRVFNNNDLEIL